MVRKDRVREEFKLAVIDAKHGKDLVWIGTHFKGDYVSRQLLISFVTGTICYFVIILMIVLAQLEDLVNRINNLDYMQLGTRIAVWYLGFMLLYMCLTALIYTIRYNRMRAIAINYLKHIKRLKNLYEREDRQKEGGESND